MAVAPCGPCCEPRAPLWRAERPASRAPWGLLRPVSWGGPGSPGFSTACIRSRARTPRALSGQVLSTCGRSSPNASDPARTTVAPRVYHTHQNPTKRRWPGVRMRWAGRSGTGNGALRVRRLPHVTGDVTATQRSRHVLVWSSRVCWDVCNCRGRTKSPWPPVTAAAAVPQINGTGSRRAASASSQPGKTLESLGSFRF